MTIAELLTHEVVDANGVRIGRVHDVRVARDDRRIHGLVVGLGAIGYRLGYPSGRIAGPWLVRRVVGLLRRDLHVVPWEHVTVTHGELHLDVAIDELERLEADR